MATYTKSASFSYSNLNSGSNLNITDLTSNDVITNIKLTSSLKFHTNISNPVKFSFYDGTTKVNTLEFSVSYNNLNANVTANSIDGTYNAMDIAYGGGTYVIAIYNDKYYAHSTNGSSFTSDNLYKTWLVADTVYPVRVLYGNSKFVIHSGRYSYYSSDGTSWTRVSMSGGSSSWRAGPTVYGNGTFIATLNGNAYYFYSTDGITWTRVSANSRTYTDGAYGGGNFVFITSDGTVDYSANGSSWSSTSIGNGSGWNGLVYDGTKFIAINTSGGIATSTNGTSWSYFANKLSAQNWKSIAYGNNMYIAIVNNSNIIAVSFDASTWYEGTLGDISKPWNRITYCNNKFWALCSSSSTQITLDPSLIYALSPNIANNNITYRLNSTSLKLTTENLPNAFEGSMNVDLSMKHPENYTITQNYYIENTTTKLKTSDTSTEVEGNSWSYPTFESTLTYNGEIYDQTTTSGDPETGAINGNKTRNVYYKLRTHIITQNYYIENTTTKLKASDVSTIAEGKSWSYPSFESVLTYNGEIYDQTTVSGDPETGTLNTDKTRNVYYKLRTHTITQHYYIENSTTKVKDDDITVVSAGKNWSYPTVESVLTFNGEIYDQTTMSGDSQTGTLDSDKSRIVYYKLRTHTITQNYYIENTTTKLKTTDVITASAGKTWSYPAFENVLTYNGEIYDQTSVSGDSQAGTLDGDKARNVYYKLRTYTLTQHYYEENTTTKVKPDDNIVVSAGKNWSFPKYSDLIKVNKVTYLYSHATGDPASGTNFDSNKERIIYYRRIESVESISLFAMPNSTFLSSLVNDKKFPYANDIEFECGALSSNSITLCDSLTDKIFKIHISISSSATASEVINLPLKIGNNVISTVYCDLMNGTAIENEDIELSASQSLVLDLSSAADRLKATNAIVKVKLFIEPIS